MDSIANLNKGDSPALTLVHPTEAEKTIQFKLNGLEWRGALSLSAYLRREEVLSQQLLTKDGGITYWILIDTSLDDNPLEPGSGTRLPLASCETYRKRALIWQNGTVQEVVCHGVGSVFCAAHLRKRGYAQRLMRELSQVLRKHQADERTPSVFSVLYSDIGKKFYDAFGWEPFTSSHVSLPALTTTHVGSLPTAQPLYAEDLKDLCEIDLALLRRSLDSRPKGSKPAVALLPDLATIQWHHAREGFVGTEIHGKAPKIKGAMVGTEKGRRVWCYWTRIWYNHDPAEAKGNTLHVLRLVIEDGRWEEVTTSHGNDAAGSHIHEAAIAALLAMAQREAAEWNMEHVELWTPAPVALAAAQGLDPAASLVDRDTESIASLIWFPEHHGPVVDQVDWIGNEKYGWC